ncbi:hypothetical protein DMUE_0162 [Dictyocoela muelleri]|nr:hypothetical protein DMUE_0162 [Dictyocoela muelleri]
MQQLFLLILRFFDIPSLFIYNTNNPILHYTSSYRNNENINFTNQFNEYSLSYPLTTLKDEPYSIYTLLNSLINYHTLPIVSSFIDLYISKIHQNNLYFLLTSILPADLTSLEFLCPTFFYTIDISPSINPFWFVKLNIFKQYEELFVMIYTALYFFIVIVIIKLKNRELVGMNYKDKDKSINKVKSINKDKDKNINKVKSINKDINKDIDDSKDIEDNKINEDINEDINHNNIPYDLYLNIINLMFNNSNFKHFFFYFTMNKIYFNSIIFLFIKEYLLFMFQCSPVVNLNFVNWMDFLFFIGIAAELFFSKMIIFD